MSIRDLADLQVRASALPADIPGRPRHPGRDPVGLCLARVVGDWTGDAS